MDSLIKFRSSGLWYKFDWDKETNETCDRINYGPYGVSSCSWIIPGTYEEVEQDEEESDDDTL